MPRGSSAIARTEPPGRAIGDRGVIRTRPVAPLRLVAQCSSVSLPTSSRPPAAAQDGAVSERVVRLAAVPADDVPSSPELVRRFRAGSREAAGMLYDRHARTVRGVLLRAMGPDQELEDLVHEVFVQFFASPAALREPEKVGSFLFGVAVRVASGELRRRRVRRRVLLTADGSVPEQATPPSDGGTRRAVAALYRILDELDARDRLVFVLRAIEEVTVADVAEVLGVSQPTVKRCAARALRHVAERARGEPSLAAYVDFGSGEDAPHD